MKQHLIILTAFFGICLFSIYQCEKRPPKSITTERVNHLQQQAELLQIDYVKQSLLLKEQNDSLQQVVQLQQKNVVVYKFRAKQLEKELKAYAAKNDSMVKGDSLSPLLTEYINLNTLKDSACEQSINNLQQVICNKDEELNLCKQVNESLRDLSAEQTAQMQRLTDDLNTAFKQQRKKVVSNRILSSGLLLVSGFAAAQLIIHTQK